MCKVQKGELTEPGTCSLGIEVGLDLDLILCCGPAEVVDQSFKLSVHHKPWFEDI